LTEVLVVFRMARTLPAKGRILLSLRQEALQNNGTKIVCHDARPLGGYPKIVHYLSQPLGEYPEILRHDLPPLSEWVQVIAYDFLSRFQRSFFSSPSSSPSQRAVKTDET
jgi:hypothetical protein